MRNEVMRRRHAVHSTHPGMEHVNFPLMRLGLRVREDVAIACLAANWLRLLHAKAQRQPFAEIRFRKGGSVSAPANVDLAFLFHEVWLHRTYTPGGYEIHDGDVVVDVGANIGVFSAFAASQGMRVRVFAYEPNKRCLPWLLRNLQSLPNSTVAVHAKALAGASGIRRLRLDDDWLLPSLTDDASLAVEEVECVTLEEAFRENGISRCDLLKLDCEGAEYEILLDAPASVLQGIQRIVAEYHRSSRGNGPSLCRHLEGCGFKVDRMTETRENEGYLWAARQ